MARAESKMVMGYLPIDLKHYAALLSLVAPATPAVRLLDPFAGEGAFLEAAAKAWNVTPYANELDGERAAAVYRPLRRDPGGALRRGAVGRLQQRLRRGVAQPTLRPRCGRHRAASASSFATCAMPGSGCRRADWRCGASIASISRAKRRRFSPSTAVASMSGRCRGSILVSTTRWSSPRSKACRSTRRRCTSRSSATATTRSRSPCRQNRSTVCPHRAPIQRFVFAPDMLDETAGLKLIEEQGAWKTGGFQALLEVPPPPTEIEPVVAPRPGHLALVLAAGVADGAVIETTEYGRVALRGKTRHVEQIARVEVEADPNDPERQVKKTTIRLKPTTTLSLLASDGTTVEMEGDEALLGFITSNKQALAQYLNAKFKPMYRFDLNGIGALAGSHPAEGQIPAVYRAEACRRRR